MLIRIVYTVYKGGQLVNLNQVLTILLYKPYRGNLQRTSVILDPPVSSVPIVGNWRGLSACHRLVPMQLRLHMVVGILPHMAINNTNIL